MSTGSPSATHSAFSDNITHTLEHQMKKLDTRLKKLDNNPNICVHTRYHAKAAVTEKFLNMQFVEKPQHTYKNRVETAWTQM